MKKINRLFNYIFIITAISFVSCEIDSFSEESQFEFGDVTAPSNLTLSSEIVGGGTGDGSGTVHFTAKADRAVNYKFVYNGAETLRPDGKMTYNFAKVGTHTYDVTVIALGAAGTMTSAATTVTVFSEYIPPAELVSVLTDKPLRVAAEEGAHMGVGPTDATSGIWWSANPYDKDMTGMYDDSYDFSTTLSFTHNTGLGETVFGKAPPLRDAFGGDKGQTANGNDEYENYPLSTYTGTYTLTAPGGQETLTLSNGFLGFCVTSGSVEYTILARTDSTIFVRTTGYDGLGWFILLKQEN